MFRGKVSRSEFNSLCFNVDRLSAIVRGLETEIHGIHNALLQSGVQELELNPDFMQALFGKTLVTKTNNVKALLGKCNGDINLLLDYLGIEKVDIPAIPEQPAKTILRKRSKIKTKKTK